MVTYLLIYLLVHVVCAALTCYLLYKIEGQLTLEDLLCSLLFGPLGLAALVSIHGSRVVLFKKKE